MNSSRFFVSKLEAEKPPLVIYLVRFSQPKNRAEEKAMKEVEVADILTGIGSMRQTPKFVSKTNKARKTAKEVSNKLEGLIPKTDKVKDILPKVKKKVPDILEGAKNLKKYYKNAYKVADNQRREAIVGKYPELLVRNEKIPSEIFLEDPTATIVGAAVNLLLLIPLVLTHRALMRDLLEPSPRWYLALYAVLALAGALVPLHYHLALPVGVYIGFVSVSS